MRVGWTFVIACVGCSGVDESACPLPGEIVVTELGVRGDAYVELFNASESRVALGALSLSIAGSGKARDTTLDGAIEPGGYVAATVPSLADDGGTVSLRCSATDDVVDAVLYEGTKDAVLALDGSQTPDAAANDSARMWCAQTASPGSANGRCALAGCDGVDARAAQPGDLLITEVSANPKGADAGLEWVEVFGAADEDVTLAGLELVNERADGSARTFPLGCEVVAAGAYIVLKPEGLALYNSADTRVSVIAADETLVDSIALPSFASEGQVAVRDGDTVCLVAEAAATPGAAGTCPAL